MTHSALHSAPSSAPRFVSNVPLKTPTTPQNAAPLWARIVAQLPPRDAATEWYVLRDLAPLLGLKPRSLAKHARDLWPNHEGHYRLSHEQAERLIRRVCWAGRKVPSPKNTR